MPAAFRREQARAGGGDGGGGKGQEMRPGEDVAIGHRPFARQVSAGKDQRPADGQPGEIGLVLARAVQAVAQGEESAEGRGEWSALERYRQPRRRNPSGGEGRPIAPAQHQQDDRQRGDALPAMMVDPHRQEVGDQEREQRHDRHRHQRRPVRPAQCASHPLDQQESDQ